jgi:hypothetical protein
MRAIDRFLGGVLSLIVKRCAQKEEKQTGRASPGLSHKTTAGEVPRVNPTGDRHAYVPICRASVQRWAVIRSRRDGWSACRCRWLTPIDGRNHYFVRDALERYRVSIPRRDDLIDVVCEVGADQDLIRTGERANAGSDNDVLAGVVLIDRHCCAHVQAYAEGRRESVPATVLVESALDSDAALDGECRIEEGSEETVPSPFDNAPLIFVDE